MARLERFELPDGIAMSAGGSQFTCRGDGVRGGLQQGFAAPSLLVFALAQAGLVALPLDGRTGLDDRPMIGGQGAERVESVLVAAGGGVSARSVDDSTDALLEFLLLPPRLRVFPGALDIARPVQ